MDEHTQHDGITVDSVLLIVVGAHLRAEVADRPLAYRLRETILRWQDALPNDVEPLDVIVCSDVWYLNNEDLMDRPTISIGTPGVSAASAYFANRLPTAFLIENTLQVQLDVEFLTHAVNIWGQDHAATVSAVDLFTERYLEALLCSVYELRPEDLAGDHE